MSEPGQLPEVRRISAQSIAFGFMGDEGDPTYNVQYVLASEHVAALRACEARVVKEIVSGSEYQGAKYNRGYADALDAAHDAVAALRAPGYEPWGEFIYREVLPAIDALRSDNA